MPLGIHYPLVRNTLEEAGQKAQAGISIMPMYIYVSVGDDVSPAADTDCIYNVLCANGVRSDWGSQIQESVQFKLGSGVD